MLKIGLTGGIGSGKTTVADCFALLGVPVIDADKISHELTAPGQPVLRDIVSIFGPDILKDDERLDRARLRAVVFNDAMRRKQLEEILHPRIRAEMRRRIADIEASATPYCILSIPLLLETGQTDLVDRVLVVDVPEDLQYQRVRVRNGLSDAETAAIIHAQISREQRLAAADDIIVNDGGLDELRQHVLGLHRRYLKHLG